VAKERNHRRTSPRLTWSSGLFGAIFCVGFPAFCTAVAPVSYLYLSRSGTSVMAEARTCLLFFVPYQIQRVEGVYQVDDRFHAGEYTRSDVDSRRNVKAEDESFLILRSEQDSLEVPVSPASIDSRIDHVQAFLDDATADELNLFCVSNWKFAVLAGVPISMLTVLYLWGLVLAFIRWLIPKRRGISKDPFESGFAQNRGE
jgi:hypothetical protein